MKSHRPIIPALNGGKCVQHLLFVTVVAAIPGWAAAECPSEFPNFWYDNTYGVACAKMPPIGCATLKVTGQPDNGKITLFDKGNDGCVEEVLFLSTGGGGKPVGSPSAFQYNLIVDGELVQQGSVAEVPYAALNHHLSDNFCGTLHHHAYGPISNPTENFIKTSSSCLGYSVNNIDDLIRTFALCDTNFFRTVPENYISPESYPLAEVYCLTIE